MTNILKTYICGLHPFYTEFLNCFTCTIHNRITVEALTLNQIHPAVAKTRVRAQLTLPKSPASGKNRDLCVAGQPLVNLRYRVRVERDCWLIFERESEACKKLIAKWIRSDDGGGYQLMLIITGGAWVMLSFIRGVDGCDWLGEIAFRSIDKVIRISDVIVIGVCL